ncbi:MAG TPA: DUF72 domain-containing protein [Pseudomonadales bacterium]
MQNSLFDDPSDAAKDGAGADTSDTLEAGTRRKAAGGVAAATPDPALRELAAALPANLRLGTSSWSFPGWAGLVWDRDYSVSALARNGLAAYARHPLMRTVSLDRSFHQMLSAAQFAQYAAQVGDDFRFVVKAPSVITDAQVRDEDGRGRKLNPNFLDAAQLERLVIEPLLNGLGHKLGALLFQISPVPDVWLAHMPELLDRLQTLLKAVPDLRAAAPDAVIAVEVRNAQWLVPRFVEVLRSAGATYCIGIHPKMPPIAEQLWVLRALWPGPLVCRWNLNPLHGAYGFEDAERKYEPFDSLQDPDTQTRNALARVIAGTVNAGHNAFVTVNNNAEGCAPQSLAELARAVIAVNESRRRDDGA